MRDHAEGHVKTHPHMPTLLREVSRVRCVGFLDAVRDLGTHEMCGVRTPYTTNAVRRCLTGAQVSKRLVARMAEKRPDLFGLRFVCAEVVELARAHGVDVEAMRREVQELLYEDGEDGTNDGGCAPEPLPKAGAMSGEEAA